MSQKNNHRVVVYVCGVALVTLGTRDIYADNAAETTQQLQAVQEQNRALQKQLEQQQVLIDSLTRTVKEIQEANRQSGKELEHLKTEVDENAQTPKNSRAVNFGQVHISGEGGVGFFNSGSKGAFPNAEFRVDEAKLFLETPIWGDVYFFTELRGRTSLKRGTSGCQARSRKSQ